ncbi:MAG: glycosyl hydrolase [Acidobacteria bacterium]|nr:glycosyl hydrolase [Acidobacteriota bacterium]
MRRFPTLLLAGLLGPALSVPAQTAKPPEGKVPASFSSEAFSGLKLRALGPAVTSGRVVDIAVVPSRPATWYVAVASGGLFRTDNAGTTWTPLFDEQASYSVGCVAVDPTNPSVVWAGSGENNSQRSVGYGDGVYKSLDGGQTWKNVGLKGSEHIGKIVIDPKHPDTVFVAAQGPLWAPGGERGLYKTTDGGKTWKAVLAISEHTGVSDVWMDPRDPSRLYAASYQRRRHVWGMVHGGPESAIHKSTDGGATWRRLEKGLPKADLGRIGLAVSPADPDVVYALIEATDPKDRGCYRSTDRGESWTRRSGYNPGGPQYYQELIPDPRKADRVYSMDMYNQVTEDGGVTWKRLGEKSKHVDNHALWIDPRNTEHLLNGNDGGVYETWDRGQTWSFKANLPVTQFYRVAVDDSRPFYFVYGGTQDNATLGGPSRTATAHGIVNSDWFVTTFGDGFFSAVDPKDPHIVYSESQYAGLVRFDRRTGEEVDIQPQAAPGEPPLRWNWDSPLIISPHAGTRLYFGAQKVFRSDDRGDNWRSVSPDLTRQVDRNRLKIMGRVWSVDAVAKNTSTSFYGNIVSLAESPRKEGLLYAGTDDGLIQVSEDGGQNWRRSETVPGVPADTYVSCLAPSPHAEGTVFAAFDNHKMGDFRPYLAKSVDRGRTWTSIAGDLPARGTVYTVIEDPAKAGLLYCGTEFGLYFSPDGGRRWVQLKGGLPTIAVRDLKIQEREGDLVAATFGRGFFVLDDLTPIRKATEDLLAREAALFPVKKAWMFIPSRPLGLRGKAFQGESFFAAPNPPFGAVFTYHLKEDLKSRKQARQEAERKVAEKGGDVFYPAWEALRAEELEEEPSILITVTDAEGKVLRRLKGPAKAGFHRVAWDLRWPAPNPPAAKGEEEEDMFSGPEQGPLAMPGSYLVSLARRVDGVVTPLAGPEPFTAELLGTASIPAGDREAVTRFQQKTARLQRAVLGAVEAAREAQRHLDALKKVLFEAPAADPSLAARARELERRLKEIQTALSGDRILARAQEPAPPSIAERVARVVESHWSSTGAPTGTQVQACEAAGKAFAPVLDQLRSLVEGDLRSLEIQAEQAGAPWTPGRIPSWKPE